MEAERELPLGLSVLRDRLGFKVHKLTNVGRFGTYTVDLSDWNLRLSNINPVIWVKKADVSELSPPELGESLRDVVRERRWQNYTIIVFVDAATPSLKIHLPRAMPTFVIIDDKAQKRIGLSQQSPTNLILSVLLSQMARSQLAPYETNRPVIGGQFFGRKTQVNRVLTNPNTNFLFIGIRRIGKTSLLKEIKRVMDEEDPPRSGETRRLYVDCTVISSEEEFLRTLTADLAPSEMKLLMGRAAQAKRYKRLMFDRFADLNGGPVTILIDELDRLLSEIDDPNSLFDVLRAAFIAGKARFIMAGFRKAMSAVTNVNSPFNNFATDVVIGKLKASEVERMILGPMGSLRVSFESQQLVNRIAHETSGLPNYVQFYCQTLLEILDEEERSEIREADIDKVYESREFRNFVIDNFTSNTVPLERALVYCVIAEFKDRPTIPPFTQRTIDGFLRKRNLTLNYRELEWACRNLHVSGVFENSGLEYIFSVPLFHRILLQTRDVDFLFEKTKAELYSDNNFRV